MHRIVLAGVALAPIVMACAPFVQTETQSGSPEQQSQTDAICAQVMGIWSGEVYYQRCEESVAYILAGKAKRQAMVAAYKECMQRNLGEGSAAFSTCMLDSISKVGAPEPLTINYPGGPDTEPGKMFDDISPKIQLNRERYACAQLELLPGSGPFEQCVASLDDALIPNKY